MLRLFVATLALVPMLLFPVAPAVSAENVNARLARMYKRVNEIRKEHNLGPVRPDKKLSLAAANHSKDIADHDLFGHRGSDGSRLGDRLRRVKFKFKLAVENVAAGYESPEKTVESWLNSPGHRRNMLDPNMCRIGLGYSFLRNDDGRYAYRHYWTIVLARPPGAFCRVK